MGMPTGEVVSKEMLPRACGCVCEFRHAAKDRFRAERLAKFRSTRCPKCVAKLEDERRQSVAARPPKGEAVQALPPGTQIALTFRPDGLWAGTLTADGTKVEAVADAPRPLPATLAQLWVVAREVNKKTG
jgi:hypothetical protein